MDTRQRSPDFSVLVVGYDCPRILAAISDTTEQICCRANVFGLLHCKQPSGQAVRFLVTAASFQGAAMGELGS